VAGDPEDGIIRDNGVGDSPCQFPGSPGSREGIGIVNTDIDRLDQLISDLGETTIIVLFNSGNCLTGYSYKKREGRGGATKA